MSDGRPNRNQLYETALAQEGLFTTKQAAAAGYSTQLLYHLMKTGLVARTQRGIYRLVHFPFGENEEFVAAWLWSEQAGVLSHSSALFLHGLSDVMPSKIHITLPHAWRHRRFRVPQGVWLHFGDIPEADRAWSGSVPVTTPARTLADCASDDISFELLTQATEQAIKRGLVEPSPRAAP